MIALMFRPAASLLIVSLSLLPACKREQTQAPAPAPVQEPGGEPSGLGPAVIVETPAPAAVACEASASSGAALLIPSAADIVGRLGPRQLMSSGVWSVLGPDIESEPDFDEALSVFRDCNVAPDLIDGVHLGFEIDTEDFVVVVTMPGIGRPELASCVLDGLQRMAESSEPIEISAYAGLTSVEFSDGRAYLVNDDELVVTTLAWQDEVARLIRCEGAPALGTVFHDLALEVDLSAGGWIVGALPPELASFLAMAGISTQGELRFTVQLGFDSGFVYRFSATMHSVDGAASAAETLRQSISGMIPSAPPEARPLLERISVDAVGPKLWVSGWIGVDELAQMKASASGP